MAMKTVSLKEQRPLAALSERIKTSMIRVVAFMSLLLIPYSFVFAADSVKELQKKQKKLQAEIEQSLHELRENVDNFQDQVQQEVGDAIANPPADSSSSNE
jgi:hypothetical protein